MFIFIPGELVSLITFPGIILHEIAHRFICDILNIPVYHVSYFHLHDKKNVGHVIHQKSSSIVSTFLIGIAPLLINSLICMILIIPLAVPIQTNTIDGITSLLDWFIIWMGCSIGFHAIPSNADMQGLDQMSSNIFVATCIILIQAIVAFCNISIIGFFIRFFYVYGIIHMVGKALI